MKYVVKAVCADGAVNWLCPSTFAGLKAFGNRSAAEIFATKSQAYGAICSVPSILHAAGVFYAVEAAEQPLGVPSF